MTLLTLLIAVCLCRAAFVVSAVATCVELGFGKKDRATDGKGNAQQSARQDNWGTSTGSSTATMFTFAAAGAFMQLGFGYIEAVLKLLNYGGQSRDIQHIWLSE